MTISVAARKKPLSWKENLPLCNGRSLTSPPPQIKTSSDGSLQGWGVSCHINVLELKAAKLAIMFFTLKERDAISVHIRMDNTAAL